MRWSRDINRLRLGRAGCFLLVGIGLTACSSFAPTAWIGKDTPEDVGEGEFPKLSDIPARPELPETAEERKQIARDLASERDRVQSSAQSLLQDGELQEGEAQEEAP